MHQILYIYDFQVSESLHGGPEFSGNYLIDYVHVLIDLKTAEKLIATGDIMKNLDYIPRPS